VKKPDHNSSSRCYLSVTTWSVVYNVNDYTVQFAHADCTLIGAENITINYPVCLFQVDFNALQIENSMEQVRRQEQERRQNLINQEKLKKVATEINGLCYVS
jgi:hypothetical protein